MNVSKIHALRVSIYDKAGMIHVNPLSKDFAPTSNGTSARRLNKDSQNGSDADFEEELLHAMERQAQSPVDYHA